MPKALFIALLALLLSTCTAHTAREGQRNTLPVTRVVDGDTFWADNGTKRGLKIRLIGVDAPETRPSQYKDVGYYGEESKDFLEDMLEGRSVYLEFDVDSLDQYGRTLAYVFLEDGTFVNAELLRGGYARMLTFPPNIKYVEDFRKLQRRARRAERGLWGEDGERRESRQERSRER